jgi:ABC-type ATPase involved in cell division
LDLESCRHEMLAALAVFSGHQAIFLILGIASPVLMTTFTASSMGKGIANMGRYFHCRSHHREWYLRELFLGHGQLNKGRVGWTKQPTLYVCYRINLLARTSALENVQLPMVYAGIGRTERDTKARDILHKVGLGDRVNHKPNELSGGQQQRVAIARALVNGAPVIMADEPTGNLDSASSIEIMTLFRNLNTDNNITIILVTHATDVATWAKRIVSFKDGLIIDDHSVSLLRNGRHRAKERKTA